MPDTSPPTVYAVVTNEINTFILGVLETAAPSRVTLRFPVYLRKDGNSAFFEIIDVLEGDVLAVSASSVIGLGPANKRYAEHYLQFLTKALAPPSTKSVVAPAVETAPEDAAKSQS